MQKSGGKVEVENYIIPRIIFRFKSRGRTMEGQESKAKPEKSYTYSRKRRKNFSNDKQGRRKVTIANHSAVTDKAFWHRLISSTT
jgi:hypothetical protein